MGAKIPKQFIEINKKAILQYTLEKFTKALPEAELLLVLPANEIDRWKKISKGSPYENLRIAHGGKTRFESVKAGLELIQEEGLIGIHDAVRPLVSVSTIQGALNAAAIYGAAIPVVNLKDSIRIVEELQSRAVDRTCYRLVQTPQFFKSGLLKTAYQQEEKEYFTDDASVVESSNFAIHLVEGNAENVKLTTAEDLEWLEFQLSRQE
jgi:2-C-methyl-D-erythritol 4-phosphate cytidylyltransferase